MGSQAGAGTLKFKIGMGFVVLSFISPLIALLIPVLGLPASTTATLVGAFLIGLPEVFIVIGAALAGKDAVGAIAARAKALLRRKGPPRPVSRRRYNTGLIMLFGSLLVGWAGFYVDLAIKLELDRPTKTIIGVVLDAILFAGFFVLGGDFWEKIKALFRWDVAATGTTVARGR